MTDVMSGGARGGVGIRIFVQGGEVARRTINQIGDDWKKMWAGVSLGERSANPALRGLSAVSQEVQGGVSDLAGRAGILGTGLSAMGVAGVAAAAALGGVALAATQAKGAMDWADALEDSAAKINIGVEALQEWRFAAQEAGGTAEDADAAIDGFQKKLGEAMAGGRAAKWFERLGFDRDSLRTFGSTEEALDAVIDRISALGSEADRAAVSDKLGLSPLIPLIRQGSDAIAAMRQEARDLGLVMDEQMVKRGAEAAREFEVMSQVIDLQLKQAFVDLGPVLVDLMRLVAGLAREINVFLNSFKAVTDRSNAHLERESQKIVQAQGRLLTANNVERPEQLGGSARRIYENLQARRVTINGLLFARGLDLDGGPKPGASLVDIGGSSRGGGGGRSGAAERAAREAEQRDQRRQRAEDETRRVEREFDDISFASAGEGAERESPQTRAQLNIRKITADVIDRFRELDRQVADYVKSGGLRGLSEEEANAIKVREQQIEAIKIGIENDKAAREAARDRLRREGEADQAALELLDLNTQLVEDVRARRKAERELLVATQAAARRQIQNDPDLSEADRTVKLGRFDRIAGLEIDLFDADARRELKDQFRSYGHELADAIRTERLGEHIAERMQARLMDMALDGLFDFLNPRGQTGGTNWLAKGLQIAGSALGFGGGRAGGGPTRGGFRYDLAEDGRPELFMLGGQGQVTSAAESARLLREMFAGYAPPSGANGGRVPSAERLELDVSPSPYFDVRVRRVAGPVAESAARRGAAGAVGFVQATSEEVERGHHMMKG